MSIGVPAVDSENELSIAGEGAYQVYRSELHYVKQLVLLALHHPPPLAVLSLVDHGLIDVYDIIACMQSAYIL